MVDLIDEPRVIASAEPARTVHTFDDPLAGFDAVATADAIASGALSPVEVVEAAIQRAERAEPHIRAVVVADYDRALEAARTLRIRGGLAGVPTFIKDMVDVEGLHTLWGSEALEGGRPAKRTAGIATQFRDMGMTLMGKSALPEFGFIPSTEPAHAAPTRNPWNLDRTTGGSSGGAAALVAAGVVPIAHGADGGGSIRIPASCCGLVGLKPTRWRLLPHREEQLLPVAVTVDGVLSRTVRDTARWFAEAERLYRRRRMPAMGEVSAPPARRLRVAALLDLPIDGEVDAPTRQAFEETVALLEGLGHRVEPIAAPVGPEFADDFLAYFQLLAFLATSTAKISHGRHVRHHLFTDFTHGLADGFRRDRGQVVGAARRLRRSSSTMARVHERFDVVLSPVTRAVSPPIGHLSMAIPHDDLLPRIIDWMAYTPLANASGNPAISLPLGHEEATGLPIGMMFGAAAGQDALLLQLAFELEAARPWPTLATVPPPPC